eukprot:CAMPEP_0195285368 /NCGR_PEP_ID=MMETSP0707-20130614/3220_1 /TAXON_ID=33640 /ORGANISM="Asterionellopsis glacialis, Strain CCMP134" /LENGTH=618 /DNA_ID=CAMNT_0040344849 /DNA_START=42 /DNA_END=1898 /DNA_ORIENTATION=+
MASPQILHIAGWTQCGFYRRASSVLSSLALLFPTKIQVVDHDMGERSDYRGWLIEGGFRDKFSDTRANSHSASPFVWFGESKSIDDPPKDYLGGHDDTLAWCRALLTPADAPMSEATELMVDDGHTADHSYDYDLVVIGGGSGGMAAAKEAAGFGAKVACLDFVKPSPQGTTWGLGGTCVNVGCIPKKLMHQGAIIKEGIHLDAEAFGISVGESKADGPNEVITEHSWETMRENVINYIRGLNFKYRVKLREKSVTYLNKLGKFVDTHTLECTDKKGRVSQITSSRFLVAVGGRPTPLDCEGGELAISSDDIFSREKSPGKTLCVGASYISLECAGFLAGIGLDVTVAVRSILLRGFDRECADMIGDYMEDHGIKFKKQNLPKKLEKIDGDRIQVTFTDDTVDVFDTVLVAIGRQADTDKLGLENVGIEVNPKNKKIYTKLEQTSCPNIYAVGDVMEGCPELTPVAIQAGLFLARRLFNGATEPLDYQNICTTVFTPIEYATVGLSEDDAIDKFGAENIEVYHSSFMPLEWSLSNGRSGHNAFTKVIVDKSPEENVLGIHFVGPNAGEVMQGYGVAMKDGLTFKSLIDTVGIHPTSSEEIVTLAVTKSSGEDAAAGGC